MPVIEARDLVVRYGARMALDGVALGIESGETFGLLGPNGAGKTTLLRVLSGVLAPDSGHASVHGLDVASRSGEVKRRVGVVPQEVALYNELTPRESLVAMAMLYGLGRREAGARAGALLETVGLAGRAGDAVGTLSGGMRNRLNIALGLVHDPAVLLLDEPTVGLDPGARAATWQLLLRLRGQGRTLVVSTHDLEEARILCGRAMLLSEGRVLASGSVDDAIAAGSRVFGGAP